MYRPIEWLQAYKQTPWRKQLRLFGVAIIVVVFAVIVGGMYLNIASRASAVGREIQTMQRDSRNLQREIKDLETDLAFLLSEQVMAQRAADLDYTRINPGDALYIQVPGYAGRLTAKIAPTKNEGVVLQHELPAAYTQSWIDWAQEMIHQAALLSGAAEE